MFGKVKKIFEGIANDCMIIAGFCHESKLKLKKVSNKTKFALLSVNSLQPIFEKKFPVLYQNISIKIEVHNEQNLQSRF